MSHGRWADVTNLDTFGRQCQSHRASRTTAGYKSIVPRLAFAVHVLCSAQVRCGMVYSCRKRSCHIAYLVDRELSHKRGQHMIRHIFLSSQSFEAGKAVKQLAERPSSLLTLLRSRG